MCSGSFYFLAHITVQVDITSHLPRDDSGPWLCLEACPSLSLVCTYIQLTKGDKDMVEGASTSQKPWCEMTSITPSHIPGLELSPTSGWREARKHRFRMCLSRWNWILWRASSACHYWEVHLSSPRVLQIQKHTQNRFLHIASIVLRCFLKIIKVSALCPL